MDIKEKFETQTNSIEKRRVELHRRTLAGSKKKASLLNSSYAGLKKYLDSDLTYLKSVGCVITFGLVLPKKIKHHNLNKYSIHILYPFSGILRSGWFFKQHNQSVSFSHIYCNVEEVEPPSLSSNGAYRIFYTCEHRRYDLEGDGDDLQLPKWGAKDMQQYKNKDIENGLIELEMCRDIKGNDKSAIPKFIANGLTLMGEYCKTK